MRYSVVVFFLVLIGCGGQPQATNAPAPVRTLSSLATGFNATTIGPNAKTYTIFHAEAFPAMTAVETVLAKRSIIADAGEGTDGIEIALEGVLCTLVDNPSPPERVRPADHDSPGAD